jgi:hypothetical protein
MFTNKDEAVLEERMRKFIRHPARIPIDVSVDSASARRAKTWDVAVGGLCFESDQALQPGHKIHLRIDMHQPFEAQAVVVWCRPAADHYDVGVQFDDEYTKYAVRMVEQACWIEDYRRKVFNEEGRKLNTDQAAAEWISRYASKFEEMQESYPVN